MRTYTAVDLKRCSDIKPLRLAFPGFPGAHSQGATLDELQANLREG